MFVIVELLIVVEMTQDRDMFTVDWNINRKSYVTCQIVAICYAIC